MADGSLHPPEAHPVVSEAPHTASLVSRALAARKALEAALEAALAVLDDMDGDTDLEPVNGSTANPDHAAGRPAVMMVNASPAAMTSPRWEASTRSAPLRTWRRSSADSETRPTSGAGLRTTEKRAMGLSMTSPR